MPKKSPSPPRKTNSHTAVETEAPPLRPPVVARERPSPVGAAPIPALLTLIRVSPGVYLLNIHDKTLMSVALEIAKKLHDCRQLILTTPDQTRAFNLGTGPEPPPTVQRDFTSPPQPEEAEQERQGEEETGGEEEEDIQERTQRLAQQAESQESVDTGRVNQGMKVIRRKPQGQSQVGNVDVCRRCNGQGEVPMMLEGGQAGTAVCPLCRGNGSIQRYGERRPRLR